VSLGVHFALDHATETRLLALAEAGDDHAILDQLSDIEENWHDRLTCHHDKAWDALHRILTDGKLEHANGSYPLGATVLGGRQLMTGEHDYSISYVSAPQVRDVSAALGAIERDWFRQRYLTLADTDYGGPIDEDDFSYAWADFEDTRKFFAKAAKSDLAVIFTVDAWPTC
jgi:Domain of unknown function (DUF1877)